MFSEYSYRKCVISWLWTWKDFWQMTQWNWDLIPFGSPWSVFTLISFVVSCFGFAIGFNLIFFRMIFSELLDIMAREAPLVWKSHKNATLQKFYKIKNKALRHHTQFLTVVIIIERFVHRPLAARVARVGNADLSVVTSARKRTKSYVSCVHEYVLLFQWKRKFFFQPRPSPMFRPSHIHVVVYVNSNRAFVFCVKLWMTFSNHSGKKKKKNPFYNHRLRSNTKKFSIFIFVHNQRLGE